MATKLTQAQLLALTKQIGLDVQVVENDNESDYTTTKDAAEKVTQDTLILSVDAARESIISQKILSAKNDEIHSSVTKKVNHSLRKALSEQLGIPVAEIDGKEVAEALKLSIEHYGKKVGGDKEAFQKELSAILAAHDSEKTGIVKEWEQKYNTKVNELTEKEQIDILVAAHNEAKGLPATANKGLLAKQFKVYLEGKAILKTENGKVVLYQKDKPDMKMLNEAKTAEMTANDLIKPYYSELGIWHEDNRNISAHTHMPATPASPHTIEKDGKLLTPLDQVLSSFPADYGQKAVA